MGIILENGYELKTTFLQDFTIAEAFGNSAISDTFKRAYREWKNNVEYATELAMVMSWKSCDWYEKDEERCYLYAKYYRLVDEWCMNHFKGDDLSYYIKTTD